MEDQIQPIDPLDFEHFVNGNSDDNPNGVINGNRVRPSDLFGRCKLLERRAAEIRKRHSHHHDQRPRIRGDDDLNDDEQDEGHRVRDRNLIREP